MNLDLDLDLDLVLDSDLAFEIALASALALVFAFELSFFLAREDRRGTTSADESDSEESGIATFFLDFLGFPTVAWSTHAVAATPSAKVFFR